MYNIHQSVKIQICINMSNKISPRGMKKTVNAIYSMWLGQNHLNATASEVELALHKSVYDAAWK